MTRTVTRLLLALASLTATTCPGADYLRDVKPLLKHKCYACHGALKQQAGFRLDTATSLVKGGESGVTVSAGKPEESLLIDVLTGDAGFQMPPDNEGAALTPKEIDVIREWIAAGAPLPEHEEPESDPKSWWSYRPIERAPLPEVSEVEWCRNDIDHFIAAQRDLKGLPHVAEAAKAVWLRRVFLDLIGLPPTRAEQDRFLADESPSAAEAIVDDLLNRPQYGERWGRHWMDVWRYSDWYGSRGINEIRYSQRHIWRWRDWIVASLNEDKGYDQMIREMLAADEISGGNASLLPATGYLGRSWYKFDRDVWMFETVERTGEAFLGLTFRCCRCHDHKFDPVSQEEYYRFRAFFEPHDVRTDPISALAGTQKDATLGQVLNDGVALVYDKTPDVATFRYERGDGRYPDKSKPLTPGVPAALGGTVDIQPIDLPPETWYPLLRSGVRETLTEKSTADIAIAQQKLDEAQSVAKIAAERVVAAAALPEITDEPVILLQDDFSVANPAAWETLNGSWEYKEGKLLQSQVTSFATIVSKEDVVGDFLIHLRYRPLSPGTYRSVGFSFDYQDKGNSQDIYTSTGDARQSVQAFHRINGGQVYPQQGIVSTSLKVGEEAVLDVAVTGSSLTIDLNGERKLDYVMPVKRRDGKFALWVHQGAAEFLELKISQQAKSRETLERRKRDADLAVTVAQAEMNVADGEGTSIRKRLAAEVARYITKDDDLSAKLASEALAAELALAVLKAQVDVAKAVASPDKLAEAQANLAKANDAVANPAGDFTPVGEQFPKISTGRRAALSAWIVNANNPRTARIAANHIWGRHVGQPLVATPENFGLNGRQPTHPQLLDWLASELMANNWRMKPLHKQIVLSATYRMASASAIAVTDAEDSSRAISDASEQDPENRFLWRMNSRRMEAEVVRDSALYLASRLNPTMGGPEIPEADGETNLRRSLYFRNTPNEKMLMLEVFDVADPNACYRRKESIVPHQSLAMMNSGLTQDSARAVAEQLAGEADFVTAAFQTVLTRTPTTAEADRCQAFLNDHVTLLQRKTKQLFSAGGSAKRAPATDPVVRARENLVHVLFLHNDFVTIR